MSNTYVDFVEYMPKRWLVRADGIQFANITVQAGDSCEVELLNVDTLKVESTTVLSFDAATSRCLREWCRRHGYDGEAVTARISPYRLEDVETRSA